MKFTKEHVKTAFIFIGMGRSIKKIAYLMGASESTVKRWKKLYKK